jgi:hypothetical protein
MFIIKSLFLLSVIHAELPDGWVAVERPDKEISPLGADETDQSIWVVFAKKIGREKFLVSFPVEPTYRYMNEDGSQMEISAVRGADAHLAQILGPSSDLLSARKTHLKDATLIFEKVDENGAELVYWKEGYWFQERLVSTIEHSYILQTKSIDLESDSHRIFASSLDIEKN